MSAIALSRGGPLALARVVAAHQSRDVIRKRWVLAYALGLALAGDMLLRLAGNGPSALVSMLNVVLLLVPLISLVLGAAALYGARDFTELLLVQPIPRRPTPCRAAREPVLRRTRGTSHPAGEGRRA